MADLQKVREKDDRLTSVSDKIEHEHLLRRFHEEEERRNMKHLLFGMERLSRSETEQEN
ncbi:MAG: hypothetical protein P8X63_09060 [Desulfuromonadaceae bacterium]